MGHRCCGDQEAALFTVRPIEGAVAGGYRTDGGGDRRCRRAVSDDPPGQGDRICRKYLRGAGGPGAGQGKRLLCGKAAMVQDLLERNVRVRESDCGRLCQMDMGALSREMEQKNYQTSFLVATAGLSSFTW